MIKSIPLQPGESINVTKYPKNEILIDYIVPDGFVAVVTVCIDLYQKYPKGIFAPGQEKPKV